MKDRTQSQVPKTSGLVFSQRSRLIHKRRRRVLKDVGQPAHLLAGRTAVVINADSRASRVLESTEWSPCKAKVSEPSNDKSALTRKHGDL